MLLFPVVLDNVKKLDFLSCEISRFFIACQVVEKEKKEWFSPSKMSLLAVVFHRQTIRLQFVNSMVTPPQPTAPQQHSGTCSEKERGIRGAAQEGRSLGLELELEVFSSVQNQISEKKVKQEKDAAEQSVQSRDAASGTPQSEESAFLDTGAGVAGLLLSPSKESKTLRGIK